MQQPLTMPEVDRRATALLSPPYHWGGPLPYPTPSQDRNIDTSTVLQKKRGEKCKGGCLCSSLRWEAKIRIKAGDWMRRWTKNSTRKETQLDKMDEYIKSPAELEGTTVVGEVPRRRQSTGPSSHLANP